VNKNFRGMKKALAELVANLQPAPEAPVDSIPFESTTFDRSEPDNSKWIELIAIYLNTAKTFEIHCWNEEQEWIELTSQFGNPKENRWKHGVIITGEVTPQFIDMLLGQPKPADTEAYNKMTPFFNVFLDDNFQSCHYGMDNYYKSTIH